MLSNTSSDSKLLRGDDPKAKYEFVLKILLTRATLCSMLYGRLWQEVVICPWLMVLQSNARDKSLRESRVHTPSSGNIPNTKSRVLVTQCQQHVTREGRAGLKFRPCCWKSSIHPPGSTVHPSPSPSAPCEADRVGCRHQLPPPWSLVCGEVGRRLEAEVFCLIPCGVLSGWLCRLQVLALVGQPPPRSPLSLGSRSSSLLLPLQAWGCAPSLYFLPTPW